MNKDLQQVYRAAQKSYRRPIVSKRIELHGQANTVVFLASGVERTFLAKRVRAERKERP